MGKGENRGAQRVLFLNFPSIAFTWEQAACGLLGGMLVGFPRLDQVCREPHFAEASLSWTTEGFWAEPNRKGWCSVPLM